MSTTLQEMDEEYEDSSDIEDEDDLNERIQKKSTDSPEQVDLEALTRSQTEPHGDLSQLQYKYKNNKSKHVIKNPSNKVSSSSTSNGKKKKNGKSSSISKNMKNGHGSSSSSSTSNKSYLSKSKSMHSNVLPKKSYKQDDIEDVDVESVEDDDDFNADIMNQTITEDEVYLDMSITAEDYAKQNANAAQISQQQQSQSASNIMKPKRSWTLDNVAKGIMSAKKRLLSPEKMSATSSNGHSNGSRGSYNNSISRDSPHSSSMSGNKHNGMYGHSPVTPDNDNNNHSLSAHSNNSDNGGYNNRKSSNNSRKDSNNSRKGSTPTSHSKKGSVSAAIFGVGKGIFGTKRSGSSKDFTKHRQSDDDEKNVNGNNNNHRKSPSKSNAGLSSIKASLAGIKYKMGGSTKNIHNNVGSKTPTPSEEQSMETRKVEQKKKTSKKKVSSKKTVNGSDQLKRKKEKKSNTVQVRKRSASQNKAPQGTDSSVKAPPKRGAMKSKDQRHHSLQPKSNKNRSSSQQPQRKTHTGKQIEKDASSSAKRYRHQSEATEGNLRHPSYGKPKVARKSEANIDHSMRLKKSNSEFGGKSGKSSKRDQYDAFTMKSGSKGSKKNKNLSVDEGKSKKSRKSKSGGGGNEEESKQERKERKEKELEKSMLAADKKCKFRIKNEIFELYEYYKPIRLIGSGAYAVVCEAIDERTKKRVAIKKNKHIFDDIRDARRILREIKLLLHFNKYKHPDLIEIYDSLPPTVAEIQDFEDVYIVMPLLESNLCKIITSKQKLSNLHYQYLTYQVLRGLKFIHEAGVIHRDIKPENILLNGSDCDVKIIDFGLARGVLGTEGEDNPENQKATEYVCTRWYRSPEVMCSGGRYDEKMDIWGVGCILAEMILRRPLFPGANYLDQLQQIFDIMGTPKETAWILNDQARAWVQKLPKHNGKNLKKMIAHKFEDNEQDLENCADLMYKLLALNPADRISAADSLSHPYFKDMHDEDEILTGEKFDLSFEFEQSIKTKFGVRHMMYTALDQYHKKQWHKIRKKQKRKEQKEREKAKANGGKSSKHKHRSSKHGKHRSSKHKKEKE